jgi:membrane protease YdiL (CAAX protease family)
MYLGLTYGLEHGKDGAIDQGKLTEYLTDKLTADATILVLISAVISLSILFFCFWNRERKLIPNNKSNIEFFDVGVLILLGISLNIVISAIIEITGLDKIFDTNQQVVNDLTSGNILIQILGTALIIPIVEEICFRGLVYNRIKKSYGVPLAIIFSSVIFGVSHLNVLQGIYTAVIGLVFAAVYHKYCTVIAPMIVHIAINSFSVFLANFHEITGIRAIIIAISAVMILIISIGYIFRVKQDYTLEESPDFMEVKSS